MSKKTIGFKAARPSRRKLLRRGMGLAIATAGFPLINIGSFQVFAASNKKYSGRVIDLVKSTQVIDMLSLLRPLDSVIFPPSPTANTFTVSDAQLQKLKSGGVNIFCPAGSATSREDGFKYMANWNSLINQHHEHFIRVDSVADMDMVEKTGKMGVIIGTQNSVQFDSVDDVDIFYNLGQRVSQLTYNSRNLIGTGSMDRADGGLSDYGVAIVERMNQVGMAVDVAHCGDQTTLDAFEVSRKPVLVTHSNSRKLSNGHRRTKTDEALKKMANKGGVIGLTGVRSFVRDSEPTNLEHLLDHFDYIGKLIGIEHLGVGSDMDPDGYDDMSPENMKTFREIVDPKYNFRDKIDTDGFSHPERIYDLVDGLIRRGYSDENIALILGGNFRRVLGEIFAV